MKKLWIFAMICGLLALFVLPAAAMHHEVKITDQPGIGRYLTDAEGMTLYAFQRDSVGHSACSGSCVNNWPVYYREQVAPPPDLKTADFATITREDGAKQTTFRGYPLYYYNGDTLAGEAKGNGIMDLWHIVDPDHFPPM